MKELISYCGVICSSCDAYLATQANNTAALKDIAEKWSTPELKFNHEDIKCDGCISNGHLFNWCTKCDIRICGVEKKVENCAHCIDYPCSKLDPSFERDPTNKQRLNEIKKNL